MSRAGVDHVSNGVVLIAAHNLTLPAGDIIATRRLVSLFLQHLCRHYSQCVKAACPRPLHSVAQQTVPLLRGLGQERMFALVRRPQLHVFICCALRELRAKNAHGASAYVEKLLFQTLFELTLDGALPAEGIRWPGPPPMTFCASPTHGVQMNFCDVRNGLRFTNDGIHADHSDLRPVAKHSEPSGPFHTVQRSMRLALIDGNPLSDFEAHPDKDGNQVSLGDASPVRWIDSLRTSLQTIEELLPLLKAEMDFILQQFVPVGYDAEQHLSASYMESIGTVYLTLHPRELTMTEAVIHEFQHNKINMLFHVDPVLHNAYAPLFSSPIRPDPRPLHGILLAAHAFVPVAELYRRSEETKHRFTRDPGFRRRFEQIVRGNSDAIEVVQREGDATEKGKMVIDQMASLNDEHRAYLGI